MNTRRRRPPAVLLALVLVAASTLEACADPGPKPAPRPDVVAEPSGPTFHVSPNGSPSGDGTLARPWDLVSALSQPASVQPGAIITLQGGAYVGTFTSTLTGREGSPIVVKASPGERATLDGGSSRASTLTVQGSYAWFKGLEVTSSAPSRTTAATGSQPQDLARGTAVTVFGHDTRFVNMVVHDAAQGFGFWRSATNSEIYGSLIYHNGWDGPDRGHGHGVYSQNEDGEKRIRDNIVFAQFGSGIHAFGSERTSLNDFNLEGNVAFANGELSKTSGYSRNILVGGDGVVARRPKLVGNSTYTPPASRGGENNLGFNGGCTDPVGRSNYFVEANALRLSRCTGTVLSDNTFVGATPGVDRARFQDNVYLSSRPSGTVVRVRANAHEKGRAHIVVYNWDSAPEIEVDVSAVGLSRGDGFEVRDAQNFYGPPVASDTYQGTDIRIPMGSTEVSALVGDVPRAPSHTSSEFGAFVLVRVPVPAGPGGSR